MNTVAIIGAGDVGGATAQALASGDCVGRLLIVDAAAGAASGKALDIQQMGAIGGFHTRLTGTDDPTRVAGCSVCVIADRFGAPAAEWQDDEGAAMLARLAPLLGDAPIVFAGAAQAGLLLAAGRDLRVPRHRLIGSAPEAFASAVAAIVAMEAQTSPTEVVLTALGSPGQLIVPLSQASIGGYGIERVLTQVQLTRIEARIATMWPPGPYALGAAAAHTVDAILHDARRSRSVFTLLDGEIGVRNRVGALPAALGTQGILTLRVPMLSTRERVRLDTSLGAP